MVTARSGGEHSCAGRFLVSRRSAGGIHLIVLMSIAPHAVRQRGREVGGTGEISYIWSSWVAGVVIFATQPINSVRE